MSAFVFFSEFFMDADELVALLLDGGDGFDAVRIKSHRAFRAAIPNADGASFEVNVKNVQVLKGLALLELDVDVGSVGLMAQEINLVGAACFRDASEFI